MYIIHISLPTSERTHPASITKTNRLLLCREIIALYCKNRTNHVTDPFRGTLWLNLSINSTWWKSTRETTSCKIQSVPFTLPPLKILNLFLKHFYRNFSFHRVTACHTFLHYIWMSLALTTFLSTMLKEAESHSETLACTKLHCGTSHKTNTLCAEVKIF